MTAFGTNSLRPSTNIEKFGTEARCRLDVVRETLFSLDKSFVSHDTKLFKRIKSSLSARESKNESF